MEGRRTRNKKPNTADQVREHVVTGKFKTNMAAHFPTGVELIEFVRPYNNEVNLYVTNISRRLDKETVQVYFFQCFYFVTKKKKCLRG